MVDTNITKNFYLLKAIDFDNGIEGHPFEYWYDRLYSVVVIATSITEARKAASELCVSLSAQEGKEAWLDPELTSCEIITVHTHHGVICSDFWRA